MSEKEYFKHLRETRASRLNKIIDAVNRKMSKEEADLQGEFEGMFFDRLMRQANTHEEKYGERPIFEMMEIETDDPVLDIYKSPAEKR